MVLVDSSVWIGYFKGDKAALPLNDLIDSNTVCVNELILAELIPFISHKKETDLKELLLSVTVIPLRIDWNNIIYMQTLNLSKGINNVGIADLMIAQNSIENGLDLFAIDKHFLLMSEWHGIRIYKQSGS
jgi:predicted nucleic acid-binding protein